MAKKMTKDKGVDVSPNIVEEKVSSELSGDEGFSDDESLVVTESGSEEDVFSDDEENTDTSSNNSSDDNRNNDIDHGAQAYGEIDDNNDDVEGFGGSDEECDPEDGSHDSLEVVESDSSEDEVAPRNTVGDVPLKWYGDEEHIGYDISGKKIKKKERQDKLNTFLANADDTQNWRKFYDEYNDEMVELSKKEVKLISNIIEGKAPHSEFDPHEDYVDWFTWKDSNHPLSNAPEPKRRFIPSKWESKKVVELVRAIRKGTIKFDKPKEEPKYYNLWEEDTSSEKTHGLSYIPAPKQKLPGHEASYNPSLEYIPTQEDIDSYQLRFEEDRPKFIPKRFTSLRSVPAYENAVTETFERCLDLYLCPRARKKRINIDPESLKPKLPSRKDLRPYPSVCYLEYKGHKDSVISISTDPSGQWIASGSSDGTARIWDIETTRCIKVWEFGEPVKHVSWNPEPNFPLLAVTLGHTVLILNTGLGIEEDQKNIEQLLNIETPPKSEDSDNVASFVSWAQDETHDGIVLKHFKSVSATEWHRKGDYFSTVMPSGESKAILIHQLTKKLTQRIPFKLHGLPVSSAFHPTRSVFFVSTKKNIRVYDLLKQKLIKKLETGMREVSSIAIHPAGDNVIVGSKEGKMCWFDMDLSSKPYRILKCHQKDITNVAFHRKYPLFASCSEDCTAYVFHGTVYADLNQNPLIVPLEILRGHSTSKGRGVMDCKFHPRQPWLFTAGSDSVIRLYCH